MNTLLTDIPSKSSSESREDEKMNARHRKRGKDEISREKREALLKDLNLEYAWYHEQFDNDLEKITQYFSKYGVQVKDLSMLMDMRGKMTGMQKMYGLAVGPMVGVWGEKDFESTVNHEAIHLRQYREHVPASFLSDTLKARLGFVKFGMLKQWPIIKKLKGERSRYGKRAAAQYMTKNSPMEFEAFFHEGDTGYLDKRKDFAYKQFETKTGRSAAVLEEMDGEIQQRIKKVEELLMKRKETGLTKEDIAIINDAIHQMVVETRKIEDIMNRFSNDDREIIAAMDTPKWVVRRLEPETSVKKRLSLLDKLLPKEHECVRMLKNHKEIKITSTQEEMDEGGVITIEAKDHDLMAIRRFLEEDPEIQALHPEISIHENEPRPCIRISFLP